MKICHRRKEKFDVIPATFLQALKSNCYLLQGIQIQNRLPEIEGVLEALMAKLEEDKPKLIITSEDAQICEAFAVTVFNRADKQDRSGNADINTVKAFYVATVFIDVRTRLTLMHPVPCPESRAELLELDMH